MLFAPVEQCRGRGILELCADDRYRPMSTYARPASPPVADGVEPQIQAEDWSRARHGPRSHRMVTDVSREAYMLRRAIRTLHAVIIVQHGVPITLHER